MAGKNMVISTEELVASAQKVEQMRLEFVKAYESIYTAVGDLRVTYKGQASDTFNRKLESYRNDFAAANKALQTYVEFLTTYASSVAKGESDLNSRAAALSTGN